MRIAITGSTGLVGRSLVRFYRERGDTVTRIVRSYAGVQPQERVVVWNPREGTIEVDGLRGVDVVIHLAGENIAAVWTPWRKNRILRSRVDGTTLLAKSLAALPDGPRVLLSGSAVGFYGERDTRTDETAPQGNGFLADVVGQWEASTAAAEGAGIRVVHMRLGNVLAAEGGALATLLPLFRLGLGAKFGNGEQCWPWVALEDVAPMTRHLIEHDELRGPVNLVAPVTTTNAELTRAIAKAVHRPSILTVPAFAARMAPGGMGQEILLGGACVTPGKLLDTGYIFRQPELEPALASILRR
jgi:uncharacterized protein (TIGR01777 family)